MKNFSRSIIQFFSALLLITQVYAQHNQNVDFSKTLKVGDKFVPPREIQLMRGTEKFIDWEALEDKVVLLDFFSTSCGTCIQIMPHLQELEEKYPDKFKVIVVTAHDKATLVKFFATNDYLKKHKVNLPVIYDDQYFHTLFPHKTEPHEVLLFKGQVKAITGSGSINEAGVLKLYKEGNLDLPLKDDYGQGNLIKQLDASEKTLNAGALFFGYQDGVPFQAWNIGLDSLTGLYKSSAYNMDMLGALRSLQFKTKKMGMYVPRMERIVWKVKDSTKYYNFKNEDSWFVDNAICYERYDRIERPDSLLANIILNDFCSFYGLKIYPSTKKIPCLVLNPCPVLPLDKQPASNLMKYSNTTVFGMFLDYVEKFPPVVDRVKNNLEMEIGEYNTLEDLNRQLAAYGVKAELAEEEIEVLVIEEIK